MPNLSRRYGSHLRIGIFQANTRFTGRTDYSDAKAFSVAQPKSVRACLGGTEGSMLSNGTASLSGTTSR